MGLLGSPAASAETCEVIQSSPCLPCVAEEALRVHLGLAAAARAVPEIDFFGRQLWIVAATHARPITHRHGRHRRPFRDGHDLVVVRAVLLVITRRNGWRGRRIVRGARLVRQE